MFLTFCEPVAMSTRVFGDCVSSAGVRKKHARHDRVQYASFGIHGASRGVFLAGRDAYCGESQVSMLLTACGRAQRFHCETRTLFHLQDVSFDASVLLLMVMFYEVRGILYPHLGDTLYSNVALNCCGLCMYVCMIITYSKGEGSSR